MTTQLPLDLALAPDYSANSFVQGHCNTEAYMALSGGQWANRALAVTGPEGSGKTHLGHVWAARTQAVVLDGQESFSPKTDWKGRALWIDNASKADEFTLFTLINLAITSDLKALLLTDRTPPSDWAVQIPDLHSRLRNVQIAKLSEPDDEVLTNILEKLFMDRGLKVSESLIRYLLVNTDRSVNALKALVADLDYRAAQEKVNVTRAFAAKHLQGQLF